MLCQLNIDRYAFRSDSKKAIIMKIRKVFILLTRFTDAGSRAFNFCTGSEYTHASIGLEEDMNIFYSFVMKGFIVEELTRYIHPDREPFPCVLYEIEVSCEVYRRIKEILQTFVEKKAILRYTRLGVILCLLHISLKWENHYFCSQFVAEVLNNACVVPLEKSSALYLPQDFKRLPGIKQEYKGDLQSLIERFGINAYKTRQ